MAVCLLAISLCARILHGVTETEAAALKAMQVRQCRNGANRRLVLDKSRAGHDPVLDCHVSNGTMPPFLPIIQSPLHAVFFCIALLLATAAWAIVPEPL